MANPFVWWFSFVGRFHKKGVSEEGCMFKDAATKGYRRRSTPALLFDFLTKTVDAWTSQVAAEDNSNSIMRMAACDAVHRNAKLGQIQFTMCRNTILSMDT